MSAVSRKAIDAWYDRFQRGGQIECLRNDGWKPERFEEKLRGQRFVWVSGKNEIQIRPVGGNGSVWVSRPRRVSDVLALSDDEITYVVRDSLPITWRYRAGGRR